MRFRGPSGVGLNLGLTYSAALDGSKSVTLPDDARAYVIAFVRDGGTKSPAEIEAIVQPGHDELLTALSGVSESQAAHKPSANDWSILELMDHVVSVKQIMVILSRSLAGGQRPPGMGEEFEEARAQDGVAFAHFATLSEARAAAEAAHGQLLEFIRALGLRPTSRRDSSTFSSARSTHASGPSSSGFTTAITPRTSERSKRRQDSLRASCARA